MFQAMGIYLYGELMISRDKSQRQLAESCFEIVKAGMETGVLEVVNSMING